MRAKEFIKEARTKSIGRDENGLEFSKFSGSGYKFVATLATGPLKGKFIAFAKIEDTDLRQMNKEHGVRVPGFFGHENTIGLAVFDDIRDAAFVGQTFNGDNDNVRDGNLLDLFSGNESIIPKSPGNWKHEPDWDIINAAIENASVKSGKAAITREKNRLTLNTQTALANFNKEYGGNYNVTMNDAGGIRASIDDYIDNLKSNPKDSDYMNAAKQAFEPFRKQ